MRTLEIHRLIVKIFNQLICLVRLIFLFHDAEGPISRANDMANNDIVTGSSGKLIDNF